VKVVLKLRNHKETKKKRITIVVVQEMKERIIMSESRSSKEKGN
jgi:hypothetical protein